MSGNGLNLEKLFAMQAQAKEQMPPLENVKKNIIDVPYIKRDGMKDIRKIILYTSEKAKAPMPLVYVPHYEMKEDSLEIRDYLLKGWAVSSCYDFKNEYNQELAFDDLVFNNAALYTLRNRADIDENKIAVVGGSAGGYMTMMLSAMQLGICCSVANGPICNLYFNFYQYFAEANRYNVEAIMEMSEEERKNTLTLLSKLPLPFVGAVCSGAGFEQVMRHITDKEDMSEWEAISPTAFAECYSNPIYINHATSDILVPLDQITHEYVYDKLGSTMPEGYNYKMGKVEGKLNYALCDRLDQSQLNLFKVEPYDGDEPKPFTFDKDKMFNVCICDEGAPEAFASHNLGTHTGRTTDINYIAYMFEQGASKTNVLTEEKLVLFAERYAGKAAQLVAHEGVDDGVYGSLAVYREEILQELKKWKADNGEKAFEDILKKALTGNPSYKTTLEEIGSQL